MNAKNAADKKPTQVESAEASASEAKSAHATLIAEAHAAMEKVTAGETELRRIEQCIASDDLSVGLETLIKADTELRAFKLRAGAKAEAAARAAVAVRTSQASLIMASFEAGEYGIDMGGLRAEGEVLASEIASLLRAYQARCETHNAGRSQLWTDVKAIDALYGSDATGLASPLTWGHEDGKKHKPFWVGVSSRLVPHVSDYRLEAVQRRVKWIIGHGEAAAAEHAEI